MRIQIQCARSAGPTKPLYQRYRTGLCRLSGQSSLFDEMRADDLLSLKIERDCGETLTELVNRLNI